MQEYQIIQIFKKHKLRATPQRIAVYKYLCENPIHPDVDTIYQSLIKDNPSFSKTTIYNSLQALEQKNLIIDVKIDNDRIHYDACTEMHGHFFCEKCKKIVDFKINKIESIETDNFDIRQRDVYYSGLCERCRNN